MTTTKKKATTKKVAKKADAVDTGDSAVESLPAPASAPLVSGHPSTMAKLREQIAQSREIETLLKRQLTTVTADLSLELKNARAQTRGLLADYSALGKQMNEAAR